MITWNQNKNKYLLDIFRHQVFENKGWEAKGCRILLLSLEVYYHLKSQWVHLKCKLGSNCVEINNGVGQWNKKETCQGNGRKSRKEERTSEIHTTQESGVKLKHTRTSEFLQFNTKKTSYWKMGKDLNRYFIKEDKANN